jgi:hypothetical protein
VKETNISIRKEAIENASRSPIAYKEIWSISGRLYNKTGSAAGMAAIIEEFEEAYAQTGQDLVLELDDGRPSHHAIYARNTLGGIRIVAIPEYPEGRQGEYVSYRSYTLRAEAVIPYFATKSLFIEFSERISISGGGARWGVAEVNRGPGVRQRLRTHSKCSATQSGSATYFSDWPPVPGPIWPYALVDELPDLELVSPETISTGSGGYTSLINGAATWTYNYEFPLRLGGVPHYLRY